MSEIGTVSTQQLAIALLLAMGVAGAAWRLGALSASGFVAASLLGGVIYGLGGWPWALLLLAFFFSSSILSRISSGRKRDVAQQFAKGGRRDWAQVAANGGVGAALLLLTVGGWLPGELAWWAYAASLAAVTADTWATELGVLSRAKPRLVTTWQAVRPGTSGGVTALGSLAALLGAMLIAGLMVVAIPIDDWQGLFWLVAVSGFVGGLIDSYLGATVQAIYFCPQCEKETEQHPLHHCDTPTQHLRGWRWMNNDGVNFLSAASAAGLTLLALTALVLMR